jgi:hypothetical protein
MCRTVFVAINVISCFNSKKLEQKTPTRFQRNFVKTANVIFTNTMSDLLTTKSH